LVSDSDKAEAEKEYSDTIQLIKEDMMII